MAQGGAENGKTTVFRSTECLHPSHSAPARTRLQRCGEASAHPFASELERQGITIDDLDLRLRRLHLNCGIRPAARWLIESWEQFKGNMRNQAVDNLLNPRHGGLAGLRRIG